MVTNIIESTRPLEKVIQTILKYPISRVSLSDWLIINRSAQQTHSLLLRSFTGGEGSQWWWPRSWPRSKKSYYITFAALMMIMSFITIFAIFNICQLEKLYSRLTFSGVRNNIDITSIWSHHYRDRAIAMIIIFIMIYFLRLAFLHFQWFIWRFTGRHYRHILLSVFMCQSWPEFVSLLHSYKLFSYSRESAQI